MIKSLQEVLEQVRKAETKTLAVAAAQELDTLTAVENAVKNGLIKAILIGDTAKIQAIADANNISLENCELVECNDLKNCGKVAVQYVKEGKAQMIMKGLISSADYLRAILNKEKGLNRGTLVNHTAVFEVPSYHKLLIVTDPAVNIAPNIKEKVQIINNAVEMAQALDIEKPKVAVLAAVEKVNPEKMPTTEDAAMLAVMSQRKQFKNCIVDGPLALDNAVSKKSAEIKGIESEVAGDADILLADDIESANILYKSLAYLAQAKAGAIVLGATHPVILTSRADDADTKLYSIALAALIAESH